jgi:protein-tyrosine phosphatase
VVTFAVLVVCTGNLCRSVAAEQLLRAALPMRDVELMSAGTHATPGRPGHPLTLQAVEAAGLAPSGHEAQRLVPEAVAVADLVLTATRDHRRAVVEADPTAAPRTFTVLEFARLVAWAPGPAGSLVELRDRAAAGRTAAPATADDDLDDPVQGGYDDHARMVATLVPAVRAIAEAMSKIPAGV